MRPFHSAGNRLGSVLSSALESTHNLGQVLYLFRILSLLCVIIPSFLLCLSYCRSWLDTNQSTEHLSGFSLDLVSEVHRSIYNLFATLGWKFHETVFPVGDLLLPLSCQPGNTPDWSLCPDISALLIPAGTWKCWGSHKQWERKGEEKHSSWLPWISATWFPWNMLWGLELITLICCQWGNKCCQLRTDPLKFLYVVMNVCLV